MTNSDLRQRAEHISRLKDQQKEIGQDIKDALSEAASAGYSKQALQDAIRVVGMDAKKRAAWDQRQMDLEMYLAEIEGGGRMAEAAE